ncbi:6-bladed beta-propeller [Candidatus Palauibacter sp.]|uniref:6-bladed beta-propeller n=1 Tax=Candidatus Palauibacter sp. TaxID=3101350 RepID=UPI003B5A7DAA
MRETRRDVPAGTSYALALVFAGLAACSGTEADVSASLDTPITLERVRTIVRQDTTPATAWLNRPNQLQYDSASGQLFGLEWGDHQLVQFTPAGEFLGYFGRPGEGPGEIRNLGDFGVGADHVTALDRGSGKLVVFDRSSRQMRVEIRLDRRLRNMAAIGDTLLAVLPGTDASLFELFHTDGYTLGSFGDGAFLTGNCSCSITHVGNGTLVVLNPDIPEGQIHRLDGSLLGAFHFAELDHVLAEWQVEFGEKLRRVSGLVGPAGQRIIGGKIWVKMAGVSDEGSFLVTATPEDLDVNPWELWRLDHQGRITDRYVFDEIWIEAFTAAFPTIYALGLGDEYGVYEYRVPQPPEPR